MKHNSVVLGAILILSAGSVLYVLSGLPLGIPSEWAWRRFPNPSVSSELNFPIAPMLLILALAGLARPEELKGAALALLLAALAVLSLSMHLAMSYLSPAGLDDSLPAVIIPRANAYFQRARKIGDLGDYLARYEDEQRRPGVQVQLSTHPPGTVLFFYGWIRLCSTGPVKALVDGTVKRLTHSGAEFGTRELDIFERDLAPAEKSGAWGAALALKGLAALAVLPLFLAARRLGGQRLAFWASLFYILSPGLYLFSPLMDQFFPLLAAMALWGASTEKPWGAAVAGLALFVGLLFSLVFLVVGGLMGLYWLLSLQARGLTRRLVPLGLTAIGVIALATLFVEVAGVDILGIWKLCYQKNGEFNAATGRSYLGWLILNPLDYLLAAGPVGAVLLAISLVTVAARGRGGSPRTAALVLSLTITLLALDLTGVNRGEVARLWLPFVPMTCACIPDEMFERRLLAMSLLAIAFANSLVLKSTIDALSLYSS